MKYFRYSKLSDKTTEITPEQAHEELSTAWKPEFVDYIFKNDVHFRLFTRFGDIWTKDKGMVPQAGFYGTIEEVPEFD